MSQFDFSKDPVAEAVSNNMAAMIDIETLGTVAGSPVVTIGAVLFDPCSCDSSEELVRRGLNIRIDLSDTIDKSKGVEGGTIRWWFEQEDAAIKALVGDDAVPVVEALQTLNRYCNERGSFVNKEFFEGLSDMPKSSTFWAKDPDFDMVLLRYYYEQEREKLPWAYTACRSVRTIQDLAWPDPVDRPEFDIPGVAHDARWDAIHQAMRIQAAMKELGRTHDSDVQFKNWEGVKNGTASALPED